MNTLRTIAYWLTIIVTLFMFLITWGAFFEAVGPEGADGAEAFGAFIGASLATVLYGFAIYGAHHFKNS